MQISSRTSGKAAGKELPHSSTLNSANSPPFRAQRAVSTLKKPKGTYCSPSTLPSLAVNHTRKADKMTASNFSGSLPVVRRDRVNLLFEDTLDNEEPRYIPTGFSRNGLKTPPYIRQAIHDAIFKKSAEKEIQDACNPPHTSFAETEESNETKFHHLSEVVEEVITKTKIMGHSAYFLTFEEKCARNPALMKVEQSMHERVEEELRKMR